MRTIDDMQIMDRILKRAKERNLSGILLESYTEGYTEGYAEGLKEGKIIGTVEAMRGFGVAEGDILEQIKDEFDLGDNEASKFLNS